MTGDQRDAVGITACELPFPPVPRDIELSNKFSGDKNRCFDRSCHASRGYFRLETKGPPFVAVQIEVAADGAQSASNPLKQRIAAATFAFIEIQKIVADAACAYHAWRRRARA